MALTGIAIYKVLPQTNCKECGVATCLAFAMKLAARQAELSACPYVSEEAKALLGRRLGAPRSAWCRWQRRTAASSKWATRRGVPAREDLRAPARPVLAPRVRPRQEEFSAKVDQVAGYSVERVGQTLRPDGVALEDIPGSSGQFAARAAEAAEKGLALILWPPMLRAWRRP